MAEIKIEKKNPIWPWIVAGIIILAVILYFLFLRTDGGNDETIVQDTTNIVSTNENANSINVAAVNAFITYADSDTTSMGLDHEYANTALLKLADATQAMADKTGYDAKADIDAAREYADKITKDPMATTHADNIERASGALSNALQSIQKANFPDLSAEAEEVTSASQAIDTDELTLDQKRKVKSFFNDASVLLKKMN